MLYWYIDENNYIAVHQDPTNCYVAIVQSCNAAIQTTPAMYTYTNYQTKKALKEAVASGAEVRIYQPNAVFPVPQASDKYSGRAAVEGPHYPKPHKWYATVELVNGIVTKVS